MPALATTPHTPRVNDAFLQPLTGLVAASAQHRPQLDFTDEHWLRLGLQRVLESVPSGRAFLQEHGPRFDSMPGRSNYFLRQRQPAPPRPGSRRQPRPADRRHAARPAGTSARTGQV